MPLIPWKNCAVLFVAGLGACSAPEKPRAPAEVLLRCREIYRPQRGRLYDRNDSLLVGPAVRYQLLLPRLPQFDSVGFNRLMGWPRGAVQARVAAARLPAPPPPHLLPPDTAAPAEVDPWTALDRGEDPTASGIS